jgi:hypothetical protein
MNKYFLMQPRQTGKTTKAIYEFLKHTEESLFVVPKLEMIKPIYDIIGQKFNNIISENMFETFIRGKRYKTLILDEYMFFSNSNKRNIYNQHYYLKIENLYIFSTSDKKYNLNIINFIKEHKKTYSLTDLIKKYQTKTNDFSKSSEDDIIELYYNFLTDDDIILMDYKLQSYKDRSNLVNIMNKEQFDIEINNIYY